MNKKSVKQKKEKFDTVVIGAGQAGLAAGYYLKQYQIDFVILDASDCVGGAWWKRWDSLQLFTPAIYDSLPGMRFPASSWHLPSTQEMGRYLEEYAMHFRLPVRLGIHVDGVSREKETYIIVAGKLRFEAKNVIVATGVYQTSKVPSFALDFDSRIMQMHSSEYRNPAQLKEGNVLVVGAGNSGAQIAMELGPTRKKVWLVGPHPGMYPRNFLGRDLFWWFYHTGFMNARADSLWNRLLRSSKKDGERLVGISQKSITRANVTRVLEKVQGVAKGMPLLENGQVTEVSNVLWCTGYRPDYEWIHLSVFRNDGYPIHYRGVVKGEPGLYFVGLPLLYRRSSSFVGGVGADAEYLVNCIRGQRKSSFSTMV